MFDVGFPELFIVAVLAIVVVGPKDLPKVIRSVMGMIKKVREMGSEFQAGVKKMADEVELEAVTRKLNEAGNIKLDADKPAVDPSAELSDYAEFDYDEYDYEGHNYEPAAKPVVESSDDRDVIADEEGTEKQVEVTNEAQVEETDVEQVAAEPETAPKENPEAEEDVKSKADV